MKKHKKEDLIADLQELARILGKTPTSNDINKYRKETGKCAGHATYCDYFGSWVAALEAAGLQTETLYYRITSDELCERMREFAKELGRPPLRREVDENRKKMPCSQTYIARFGSWRGSLEAAGLTMDRSNRRDMSDEELIDMLCSFAEELGRKPTVRDLESCAWMPCYATIANHFGTWNKALKKAGLYRRTRKPHKLTKEEKQMRKRAQIMRQLEAFVKREGRIPAPDDLGKKSKTPCYRTCVSYLGSWQKTLSILAKKS